MKRLTKGGESTLLRVLRFCFLKIVTLWFFTACALGDARQRVPCAISITNALHYIVHLVFLSIDAGTDDWFIAGVRPLRFSTVLRKR